MRCFYLIQLLFAYLVQMKNLVIELYLLPSTALGAFKQKSVSHVVEFGDSAKTDAETSSPILLSYTRLVAGASRKIPKYADIRDLLLNIGYWDKKNSGDFSGI